MPPPLWVSGLYLSTWMPPCPSNSIDSERNSLSSAHNPSIGPFPADPNSRTWGAYTPLSPLPKRCVSTPVNFGFCLLSVSEPPLPSPPLLLLPFSLSYLSYCPGQCLSQHRPYDPPTHCCPQRELSLHKPAPRPGPQGFPLESTQCKIFSLVLITLHLLTLTQLLDPSPTCSLSPQPLTPPSPSLELSLSLLSLATPTREMPPLPGASAALPGQIGPPTPGYPYLFCWAPDLKFGHRAEDSLGAENWPTPSTAHCVGQVLTHVVSLSSWGALGGQRRISLRGPVVTSRAAPAPGVPVHVQDDILV